MDLRFQDLEQAGGYRNRRVRGKYLKARKIKDKKARNGERSEFADHEQTALDASTERRRLQAIEAQRSERMEPRLGIHLPFISEVHSD
ncbi:unnamed protein product [Spirodela intermedia]|uniref:Uncharacterized protein n=1 Tax=Spirodela intermedia TaxID=51605 RepID=A0A7I8IRP9_SPIIN|nr:unnamed protein product [Spirodela intermedia]CAA6660632.1 unnamed protein product [Spirodela intermedia]